MGVPVFLQDKSNPAGYVFQSVQEFALDSIRLVRRCTKPDAKGKFFIKNMLFFEKQFKLSLNPSND
ncbi:putative Sec61-gamma subunit of protein translocation complex [Cryptosporidium canis]|uniref:Sec61-gamma subunit of protein translocation complex n=1 Tax=Cryptosporidium canis TaxID=195482 RepID=A0A9D5HZ35_9CRYT|nr:putative Sec61-gamma subunit of protein translocation complex [Cryptosporidium canis]